MSGDDERLGPTGEFPDGKLSDDDEGELRLAVRSSDGLVYIHFGKLVSWLAMPPEHAIEFARILLKHAGEDEA